MVLTVRALKPENAEAWKTLRLEAVATYPDAFLATADEVRAMSADQITQMLEAGMWLGVFEDGALAGMTGMTRPTSARAAHRAEIGGFYIRPACQGNGAADALMQALVVHVRALGIWQLELCVAEKNPRAIRFYERHKFLRQGRMPNIVIGAEGPETDLFYTRDLRG
ncbi:GNAT family N-acetyltransferase [Salipiger abyssi]|uniref:GNAT family N-acetyltransferase n=1 Tax=Salipiger abyssi TaxID=1250539 RepID=UPI001A8D8124|nr:GNAT family N-acetyltransferase [Salipiger abyssi]MBN9886755.1 GNAT family N-acetyltransferase [Salipiger abyssi]